MKPGTTDQHPFRQEEAHDSLGFLLWQVSTLWHRAVAAALHPHDLTQVQFVLIASLLWLARREGRISQAMLARHAKLDAMMTSQVLRSLERRGLVVRKVDPHDARARALSLTAAGRKLALCVIPTVEAVDDGFFAAPGRSTRAFAGTLRGLIAAAGRS